MEAFSVEFDESTNSLIVLGSPVVFGFIEENLLKIDTPANAAAPTRAKQRRPRSRKRTRSAKKPPAPKRPS